MKPHKDVTIDEILNNMLQTGLDGTQSDLQRSNSEGTFVPVPLDEKLEAEAKLRELAVDDSKILVSCIGCFKEIPIRQSTPCECGGFVCGECRTTEGDDECLHVLPFEWQHSEDD